MKKHNKVVLYDTKDRQKRELLPRVNGHISMYVCGITPYSDAHVGHGRCYVHFDIVYRTLMECGYSVEYVRNVTDIDDKIINKSPSLHVDDIAQTASGFYAKFKEDMAHLGTLEPCSEPHVSTYITEIMACIQSLIEKGHAYRLGNDVYFDCASYVSYGELSGKQLDDLLHGVRIDANTDKRNMRDFALWKGNDQDLFWKAPWGGHGRPGWHIECSAFIHTLFKSTIDIHGGGIDLIFPHHENERAQSECLTGEAFVNYWMHNAHVTLNKEKMSKSTGNFFTLRDVFKKYDPMVVRFYLLQHHYRTPLDFSDDGLEAARKAYKKLIRLFDGAETGALVSQELLSVVCDDFNTPKALGLLFAQSDRIASDKETKDQAYAFVTGVLGLTCAPVHEEQSEAKVDAEVAALIEERERARAAKDWATADRIRDELKERGIQIQDKK